MCGQMAKSRLQKFPFPVGRVFEQAVFPAGKCETEHPVPFQQMAAFLFQSRSQRVEHKIRVSFFDAILRRIVGQHKQQMIKSATGIGNGRFENRVRQDLKITLSIQQ